MSRNISHRRQNTGKKKKRKIPVFKEKRKRKH